MSRKNRKKTSPKNCLKDLLNGCLRLTIVIAIFLSGNDYHITTVIQLNASHREASGVPADSSNNFLFLLHDLSVT